ncbi:MAG: S9 family peptidase [Sphingobacterium thalpophilum]
MKRILLLLTGLTLIWNFASAQDTQGYQKPPQPILSLFEARSIPTVKISSNGEIMLLLEMEDLPSISELSQPELRLAGQRINPVNNGQSRTAAYSSIKIKAVNTGIEYNLKGLPNDPRLSEITWSPDESKIAFIQTTENSVELWVADLESLQANRLSIFNVNNTYGNSFIWNPDGKSILGKFIPDGRSELVLQNKSPQEPLIQENTGKSAPVPTYQDLLKNPDDEKLFDHYFTSQLKQVNLQGQSANLLKPLIIRSMDYSPDGKFLLLANITRPYSYQVPINAFPFTSSIFDEEGKLIKKLYDAPLAENIPAGFDGVPKGPRAFGWRTDKGAVLYWVEALDNGNPAQQATVRDVIYTQEAPFNQYPLKLADCYFRFNSIVWGDDKVAILTERWWKTRFERRSFIKPSNVNFRVNLYDRYFEDGYGDPGVILTRKNEFNRNVLLTEFNAVKRISDPDNVHIFTLSDGASPEGDRPFIKKFNIKTKLMDTLFRSKAPYYERPVFFNNGKFIINSRESSDSVKNYFKVNLEDNSYIRLTDFSDPYPELKGVKKQQISYKRLDGITLGGTLYLPATFKTGDPPLPMLIWAYPREFKTAAAAGQIKGSPHKFSILGKSSPVYWVTRGYAVLDNADMPVIGESNTEPNDTFVEQIRYNAEAAINHLVDMGIADRKRIAIGGHSYGAFMTANLLAHTDLFAAGIARSGAYNRSLTPFGFQAEERTFWQAPAVYNRMSPFAYADKIKTPILLIHGQADNNTGTFPMQSERFYTALKGHGATARLVLLPSESHAYQAKESLMHMLWEMDRWLEKYVKNK